MPTPFTDAPDALLRLWNKFALHRGFDANNPPPRHPSTPATHVISVALCHAPYRLCYPKEAKGPWGPILPPEYRGRKFSQHE